MTSVGTHLPSSTSLAATRQAAVRQAFVNHLGVRHVRVAATKNGAPRTVPIEALGEFAFWTPPAWPNLGLLTIDVDRDAAVLELFAAPALPHVVVETPRGAQAVWLIDRVHTGPNARPHPIAYAETVGSALRASLDGDSAVDPLRPVRTRNPCYRPAQRDVFTTARPLTAPYRLGELQKSLDAAGAWPTRPERSQARGRAQKAVDGVFVGRNDAVNRSTWLTVRYGLENGSVTHWTDADVLELAHGINEAVAAEQGVPPLPEDQVRDLAVSICRHQHRPGRRAISGQGSATARALGAKGGAARSEAKTISGRRNVGKATAVRSASAALRSESIRILAEQGHTYEAIAAAVGCSTKTVQRALRDL